VLAGNTNAYQNLVETHQSRVYGLALRMLGNEREAEDAAQDAFVQAFTKLRSYNSEWRFKTWIMTITNNLCIDKLRRRKLEPTSFTDYAAPTQAGEDERELEFESNELPPDAVAAQNEQRKLIAQMIRQLPEEDRSMVQMFYWDDLSYEDIAKATNSTVSAVKSRLFRARRALAHMPMIEKVNAN
jgi:RNA polymerase sigma-70 factor (ECF subfamily)